MAIKVQVEKSTEGIYWGSTQNIPGGITADGVNFIEMKKNLKEALELYFETAEELSEKDILKLKEGEIIFEFSLNLSDLFEKFNMINKSKFAEMININSSLLRQYSSNKEVYVSEQRAKEIERGLHSLGEQLQAIRL